MFRISKRMVHVDVVRALEDNFMYIFRANPSSTKSIVVDPVEPKKLFEFAAKNKLEICGALVTHHHWDHAGGTPDFRKEILKEKCPIVGGDERIEFMDKQVKHEEQFEMAGMKITSLSTPCHTKGHICYHVTADNNDNGVVFTGDTLFIAGCGKFFEGTAPEMHRNLNEVLASLPDDTAVYPGHEYTTSNLKFALDAEPNNQDVKHKLKWAEEIRKNDGDTVPSSIGEEKKINPFMRVSVSTEIQRYIATDDPIEGMKRLRDAKNNFRPKM